MQHSTQFYGNLDLIQNSLTTTTPYQETPAKTLSKQGTLFSSMASVWRGHSSQLSMLEPRHGFPLKQSDPSSKRKLRQWPLSIVHISSLQVKPLVKLHCWGSVEPHFRLPAMSTSRWEITAASTSDQGLSSEAFEGAAEGLRHDYGHFTLP